MSAVETVRGSELRVGDTIRLAGKARQLVRIEPYTHPVLGEAYPARLAYWPTPDDHPDGVVVFDQDDFELLARGSAAP